MTNVIKKVRKYFVDKGLKTNDIPKALVIHEIMGILMLALTWNASYRWPMSSNPVVWNPIKGLLSKVPTNALSKVSSGIKALPLPPKVTEAYIESSCIRKVIRPVTLPGKLWLTYLIVNSLNQQSNNLNII